MEKSDSFGKRDTLQSKENNNSRLGRLNLFMKDNELCNICHDPCTESESIKHLFMLN